MKIKSLLKRVLGRKSLFFFRLRKFKQFYVELKLALSGIRLFEFRPVLIKDLKISIKEARQHILKNHATLLVVTDCEKVLKYCKKKEINCFLLNEEANCILPELNRGVFVIYAVNKYSNGKEVAKLFFENKIPFLTVHSQFPSNFLSENREAETAMREAFEEQVKGGWDKFDLHVGGDFENLLQAIFATRNIRGAYVEIGAFNGSSGDVALRFMTHLGLEKRCVFVDNFAGFLYEEAMMSSDRNLIGTHLEVNESLTRSRLEKYASNKLQIEVRKQNICLEGALDDIGEISCANIDVDLYEAVLGAWKAVCKKLSVGGIVLIEDAGHMPNLVGARVALDKILHDHPNLVHLQTFSGQHILVKTSI